MNSKEGKKKVRKSVSFLAEPLRVGLVRRHGEDRLLGPDAVSAKWPFAGQKTLLRGSPVARCRANFEAPRIRATGRPPSHGPRASRPRLLAALGERCARARSRGPFPRSTRSLPSPVWKSTAKVLPARQLLRWGRPAGRALQRNRRRPSAQASPSLLGPGQGPTSPFDWGSRGAGAAVPYLPQAGGRPWGREYPNTGSAANLGEDRPKSNEHARGRCNAPGAASCPRERGAANASASPVSFRKGIHTGRRQ